MTAAASVRITTLDGLRGLACLLVYVRHAGIAGLFPEKHYSAAVLGLMLFFTLSGFLMAYHYLPGDKSARYWGAFLIRRFFRMYPAFMFLTFFCFIAYQLGSPLPHYKITFDRLIQNWFVIKPAFAFWTIHIEIKFYALFAAGGVALLVLPVSVKMKAFILFLAWASLSPLDTSFHDHSLLSTLPYFVAGALGGYLVRMELLPKAIPRYIWNTLLLALLAGVITFVGFRHFPTWLSSFIMLVIILSAVHAKGFAAWLLANRASRFMGDISYSFYIVHCAVLFSFKHQTIMPVEAAYVAAFVLTFCISCLMYWLIERPGIRLGKALAGKVWA